MKAQAGFTLIELVIVMVIVGLLAAVASPKFFDFQSTARTNASSNIKGSINSAMAVAFANHRAAGLTASGATAGSDEYITTCASLTPYMDGGLPSGTTCAAGVITFPDGTTSTMTAETNTARATAP